MKKKKVPFSIKLLIAMAIYAVVFVCAAWFGFSWFWDYIAEYEASRPQNAIEAYMDELNAARIQAYCKPMVDSIDHNIQSVDECNAVIAGALSGGITYARKLSECDDTTMVYMLMSDGKTIGKVTFTAKTVTEHEFPIWSLASETFDMSHLIGQGASVTVPENYHVYAGTVLLTEKYVTQRDILFESVKDYYEDYDLPTKVTYTVEPILGDVTLTVRDPQGNEVTPKDLLDEHHILNSCTAEELEDINSFLDDFLSRYVAYTTNVNLERYDNYDRLKPYLLEGSALQQRMYDALSGLKWVKDRKAKLLHVDPESIIPTGDGHLLCRISYTIQANDKNNQPVEETYAIELVIAQTAEGLKAQSMYSE